MTYKTCALRFLFGSALLTAGCFPDPALLDDDAGDGLAEGDTPIPGQDAATETTGETASGECMTAAECGHLAANCVKVICLANTCATQPDPGAACDDGNACTKNDVCAGTTCAGTTYACDDGVECTEDRCDGLGGCTYPVADGACRIDGLCVAAGQTKSDDPCRVCTGGEAWSPNDGASCEDGDTTCTLGDSCEGTTCVGGPRPSDAETDWAFRPVDVTAPGTSAVVGLVGFGADVVLVSESTGDAGAELTTGSRTYPGSSLQVLRRSATGLSEYMALTGFDYARVVGAGVRDADANTIGFGYRFRGTGEFSAIGTTSATLSGEGYEAVSMQIFPANLLFRVPFSHIHSTASTHSGLVVLSEFTESFSSPPPMATVESTTPGGPPELAITSLSAGGATNWVAHVGSAGRMESASLCASRAGVVHLTIVHADALVVTDGLGSTQSVTASGDVVKTTLMSWAADGRWLGGTTVAQSESVAPGDTSWRSVGAFVLDCDDSNLIATIPGRLGGQAFPISTSEVDGSNFGFVSIGVGESAPQWQVALVGATPMALSSPIDGQRWLTAQVGATASWKPSDGAETAIGHGGAAGSILTALRLSQERIVDLVHPLTSSGVAIPMGVARISGSTIVVGGSTLFAPPTFSGADGSFPLAQTSDVGSFLFGFNSSAGLECLYSSE